MKVSLLRYLFLIDAAVLSLLGALLIFAPKQIEAIFGFRDLPPAASYLIGLWGCALVTLGAGYVVAAGNPLKHGVWAQVGIARGLSECVLGTFYWIQGVLTFQQAAFGIIAAAFISLAYLLLYPRKPRAVPPEALNARTAVSS